MMYKNILLCTDGSEQSLIAARAAAAIASKFDAQLTLLTVFDDTAASAPYLGAWQMGVDPEALARYAAEVQQQAEHHTGKVIEEAGLSYQLMREKGHPVDAIVAVAERMQADLIVLGSRGLGAWRSVLLGSVSDGVVHHAHCPVLIVRGEQVAFHKLLATSDGSDGAFKATEAAMKLASAFGSELTVLNVFDSLATYTGVRNYDLDPEVYAECVRAAVKHRLNCAAEAYSVSYNLIQQVGHPAQTIVQVAEESHTDPLLLGSVSDRVLHQAHCPVLIVR